ncbi:MAG: hypothetical protein A2170_17435 [Deltaproteobacteria bacterium RBG_13_53_10]|nr:MAG: hypothetical protein A2170_17435 [Deltaproteobacteria bacterium RBG_13_53_10]
MYLNWTKTDIADYKKCQNEWLRHSKTDYILYDMCKKWPDHRDLAAVQAKVIIIARTYSAGLERKGRKEARVGVLEKVAEILYQNGIWIDPAIRRINRFNRLSQYAVSQIMKIHGRLVGLLRSATNGRVKLRSFVSKYLHFHVPTVPIFDSRACRILSDADWYPWRECRSSRFLAWEKGFDASYYRFMMQFLLYFSDLLELNLNPSVRRANYYLVYSAS